MVVNGVLFVVSGRFELLCIVGFGILKILD